MFCSGRSFGRVLCRVQVDQSTFGGVVTSFVGNYYQVSRGAPEFTSKRARKGSLAVSMGAAL